MGHHRVFIGGEKFHRRLSTFFPQASRLLLTFLSMDNFHQAESSGQSPTPIPLWQGLPGPPLGKPLSSYPDSESPQHKVPRLPLFPVKMQLRDPEPRTGPASKANYAPSRNKPPSRPEKPSAISQPPAGNGSKQVPGPAAHVRSESAPRASHLLRFEAIISLHPDRDS